MSYSKSSNDFADSDWPSSRHQSTASSTYSSETTGLLSQVPSPFSTPRTSILASDTSLPKSVSNIETLVAHSSVTVAFSKGNQLFKLKFTHIDVCKDPAGNLRCLELRESSGQSNTFIHAFPNTKLPVPHIEKPIVTDQEPSLVVTFLDEQTVQTAGTLFSSQPHYKFERWEDCVRFQEIIFDQKLLFIGGVAEAKSKGRGEESLSQNLRVLRARSGRQTILLFANSQRKEKKRYISIPLDCIDHIDQGKKAGRPIVLKLQPNFELLAQLKVLQILFLNYEDQKKFHTVLGQGDGA